MVLTPIKENGYAMPAGVDIDALIADMLTHVGCPDNILRDGLIYSIFGEWTDKKLLSPAQMKFMLTTSLGENHLFYKIGENGSDSVFTRSFSALVIALALGYQERHESFLTVKEITEIKNTVFRYVGLERDFRGYVAGKGWAHAAAHIADVLACIAGLEFAVDVAEGYNIGREALLEVLDAVKGLICNPYCVYTAEEDERLVAVVNMAISHEILTEDELKAWIKNFCPTNKAWYDGTVPDDFYIHVNRKYFMRSLYFNFMECDEDEFDTVRVKEMSGFLLDLLK